MALAKKPAAAMKRKSVLRLTKKKAAALEAKPVNEADEIGDEADKEEVAEQVEQEEAQKDEGEENQEETQEERQQREEQETQDQRSKELKSMAVDSLKALVKRLGLDEKQKKAALVETVVAHEAKIRADKLAHAAKLRAVVLQKKAELEGLSVSDLAKACDSANIVGARSKQDRVEQLLKRWLDADGIAKALRQQEKDARRQELLAMDSPSLRQLCEERGIDPFVHEVAADRLLWRESAKMAEIFEPKTKDAPKVDLVDSLLLREKEKQQQEDDKEKSQAAQAAKKKEIKAMSVEELKEALASREVTAEGNKEALVDALLEVQVREEAAKARKQQLTKMPIEELKALLLRSGLDAGKRKRDELAAAMLQHEAQAARAQQAREGARREACAAKMQELAGKSAAELKEMCSERELAVGGSKDAVVGRLAEFARQDGEIDRLAAKLMRAARGRELRSMDKVLLVELCEKASVDPCVKEVMAERIMACEEEAEAAEPAAKRARH